MFVSLEIYSLYPEKFRSTQKHGSVETVERATTKEFFSTKLTIMSFKLWNEDLCQPFKMISTL